MGRLVRLGVPGGKKPYVQRIRALGPIRLWPLYDAVGSSSAIELIAGDNGTPTNVTFGVAGIGDGRTAASFNGNSSQINIAGTGLAGAFPKQEGTFITWCQVSAAGVWTDSTIREIARFLQDANNFIYARKETTNNTLGNRRKANATDATAPLTVSLTGWFLYSFRWSDSGNYITARVNDGTPSTINTADTWAAGTLTTLLLGSAGGAEWWSGSMAYAALFDYPLSDATIAALARI